MAESTASGNAPTRRVAAPTRRSRRSQAKGQRAFPLAFDLPRGLRLLGLLGRGRSGRGRAGCGRWLCRYRHSVRRAALRKLLAVLVDALGRRGCGRALDKLTLVVAALSRLGRRAGRRRGGGRGRRLGSRRSGRSWCGIGSGAQAKSHSGRNDDAGDSHCCSLPMEGTAFSGLRPLIKAKSAILQRCKFWVSCSQSAD